MLMLYDEMDDEERRDVFEVAEIIFPLRIIHVMKK